MVLTNYLVTDMKLIFAIAAVAALSACGTANAQGKALNNNPNLVTLQDQINAAKISGSCGDGSYLSGVALDGSLICKAFTQQGFTVTVVSQSFTAASNATFEATAACPTGERATGGGALSTIALLGSYPLADGTGWKISGKALNPGASGTAYAVCLK